MKPYKFIISGGGTGGHIYPAIAIADALKERYPDAEFLFVGASDRMEMEKVPKAGYKIEGLWIAGLQRKLTVTNLMFPFKLISSLIKSASIIRKFKPDCVIGTGGFASGPLLEMGARAKVPALIQEQNSYAGITNKLLAKKVQKICVAYDRMEAFFPAAKIVKTGNPVRQDLLEIKTKKAAGLQHYGLNAEKPVLLIIGGSLGSKAINALIHQKIDFLLGLGLQVIWQTGKLYYELYKPMNELPDVQVRAYIDAMDLTYAAADMIISRAGASSVSELCIVGKPVLFIPSPNVAEDHQTKNAMAIVEKHAALMLAEKNVDKEFESVLADLVSDKTKQEVLGNNIKALALPNATQDIVAQIEQLIAKGS